MIVLLINAAIIYGLFAAFSSTTTEKKRENTTELAVLSVIGTTIIFLVVYSFLGRIPALVGSMIWLFISFHYIGKLPLSKSLIAAVCMFLVNMVIGVVLSTDQITKKAVSKPQSFSYPPLPTSSPYHYTNAPDPLSKSFEDRLNQDQFHSPSAPSQN